MAMATASNCIKIYICERAELLLSLDRPTGRMAVASASCPFPAPGPIQAAGLQPVILPCHDCDKWRKMMPATTGTTALSVFVLLPGSSAYIPAGPLSCFSSPFPSSARLWYIFYVCKHTHTLIGGCVISGHIKCSLQFAAIIQPSLFLLEMQPKIVLLWLVCLNEIEFLVGSRQPIPSDPIPSLG